MFVKPPIFKTWWLFLFMNLIINVRGGKVYRMRKDLLENILVALREIEGYFVFKDEVGKEFVILGKREFDERGEVPSDTGKQLSLSSALLNRALEKGTEEKTEKVEEEKASANKILEKINRDIALYKLLQEEEEDLIAGIEEDEDQVEIEKPEPAVQKVRFEPLKGDLPPELQE
jgi:hypothetical protein